MRVGAIVAVNAFGDIIDPSTGRIVAGARLVQEIPVSYGSPDYFADTLRVMQAGAGQAPPAPTRQNTVIGVVVTNALLNKEQATKVAQMAQDGLACTVRPAHTMWDGDTIFTLAAGPLPADVNTVGGFAAEVVAQAVLGAVARRQRPGRSACSRRLQRLPVMKETILVVEDNPVLREGLRDILSYDGYSVLSAPDGQQALDQMETLRPT